MSQSRHTTALPTEHELRASRRAEPIAIIGIGCRFPGGANDPAQFWCLLTDGVDAISDVPEDRWHVRAFYDPEPGKPGKTYTRRGGFISGIDQFDASLDRKSTRLNSSH